MKKRKIMLTCIMLFILAMILTNLKSYTIKLFSDMPIEKYEIPIGEDGTINNEYFSISSNGTNEKETTQGINKAIEFANRNNIKYIKLENGEYLIDGTYSNPNLVGGIQLKSNIHLDFNNSKIIQKECKDIRYSIIGMNEIENCSISNGIIMGDSLNHNYTDIQSTHEWGFGIEIKSCENINVNNIEIKETTGDGIIITSLYGEKYLVTDNINVEDCNIHNCRRNGISIISATNVNIYNNEIHNIIGTAPQSAIILESWSVRQTIDNINIYKNKIYDNVLGVDVQGMTNNVNIYENISWNSIAVLFAQGTSKIYNNIVNNAMINIDVERNVYDGGRRINKAIVDNNKLIDSGIYVLNVENCMITNNEILNSNISVYGSNCLLDNNIVKNEKNSMYWAFRYYISKFDKEKYDLYIGENIYEGNYGTNEFIMNSERINIHNDNFIEYKNEFK